MARLSARNQGHLPLVKVNPLQARRVAQACGTPAKTDQVDAAVIAQMGRALDLQQDVPARESHCELKELQIVRTALVKDCPRPLNRIKTQTLTLTKRRSKARLRQIEASLKEIVTEIKAHLRVTNQGALAHDTPCWIAGIGDPRAAAILITCPKIGTLACKHITSLAGLAPMTRQSGQWRGQAFIRGGRKLLRDVRYMPALAAVRSNPDRITRQQNMSRLGKPRKAALIFIMRKRLDLANALVKAERKCSPEIA